MVRFNHDMREIGKETARALLGKKGYIADVFERELHDRQGVYKLSVYTYDDGITVYIANSIPIGDENRLESVITMRIYGKGSLTDATKSMYEKGRMTTSSRDVHYRDWIVPSEKKLAQIISRFF